MKNLRKALRGLLVRSTAMHRRPKGFDPALYLQLNPDVREAGADPVEHFLKHGQAEGRPYAIPTLVPLKEPSGAQRPAVLVVCHEASRSGAPILGLNLVQDLRAAGEEVVVLLLGKGPLVEDFTGAASAAYLCTELRFTPSDLAAKSVVRDLCRRHAFTGAIVNSVECRAVLHGLAQEGVPTVALLHEFAAYTRPAHAFPRALFWSSRAVFSARVTRDDAFRRLELRDAATPAIVPQGKCTIGTQGGGKAVPAPRFRAPPPGGSVVNVLGVGAVQYRKGVDLFVECATRMRALDPATDYRFYWVGGGYQPATDLHYSAYLADQIQRCGLGARFQILGETDRLDEVYAQADLFLLTSRLDPLPNVGIDAASQGLPLLCFAETTGIADFLLEAGLGEALVAPYMDPAAMARQAVALARDPALRARVSGQLRERAAERFSMAGYVASLRGLLDEAAARLRQEQQDAAAILQAGVLRPDVCVHPAHPQLGEELASGAAAIAGTYVRAWASGLYRRKPFAGFHPAMYADAQGLRGEVDPLAHWLRAGRPEGPWSCPVLTPAQPATPAAGRKVALHVHAYYVELLDEIVARLARNTVRPDLFVTVTSAQQAEAAAAALRGYAGRVVRIDVVPNRGRDLGPLLATFAGDALQDYELAGHLHTKKSLDVEDRKLGGTWYRFLLENLVGGSEGGAMLDRIVTAMDAPGGPRFVFPEDPYVFGDGSNAEQVEALARRAGWPAPPAHYRFPVGSMFLARPAALRPLLDLGLGLQDYPEEPLPYDGTLLHALERALGLAAAREPGALAVTNIPGVTR